MATQEPTSDFSQLQPLSEEQLRSFELTELPGALANIDVLKAESLTGLIDSLRRNSSINPHARREKGPLPEQLAILLYRLRENAAVYADLLNKNYVGSDVLASQSTSDLQAKITSDCTTLLSLLPPDVIRKSASPELSHENRGQPRTGTQKLLRAIGVALIGAVSVLIPSHDGQRHESTDRQSASVPVDEKSPEVQEERKKSPEETPKAPDVPKILDQENPDRAGSEEQGPDLSVLRNREGLHDPDINAADLAKAGENEGRMVTQLPIAEVRDLDPALRGQLWSTATYEMGANRQLVRCEPHVQVIDTRKCGTVVMGGKQGLAVSAGKTISLPRPVGYAADHVTLTPFVPHRFDVKHQRLTFHAACPSVRLEYSIYRTQWEFFMKTREVDSPTTGKPLRPDDAKEIIESLKELEEIRDPKQSEAQHKAILTRALSGYTYITSRQLNMLIEALARATGRATTEEVTAYLKVGDCDSMARDVTGLQGDGKVRGGGRVHIGLPEHGGVLSSNPLHAVADVGGKPFETTDKVRASYQHVQFLPEDLSELLAIVKAVPKNPSDDQRIESYGSFRSALFRILAKDHYQQYCNKSSWALSVDDAGLALSRAWQALESALKNSFRPTASDARKVGTGVLLLAAGGLSIAAAIYLAMVIASTLYRKLYDDPQQWLRTSSGARNAAHVVKIFQDMQTEPSDPEQEDTNQRTYLLDRLYYDSISTPFPLEQFLPRAEVNALPPARQRLLIRMLTLWPRSRDNYGNDVIFFPNLREAIAMSLEDRRILNGMKEEKDLEHFHEFIDACRRISVDPKQEKQYLERIPDIAADVMKSAKNIADKTLSHLTISTSVNSRTASAGRQDPRRFGPQSVRNFRGQPQGDLHNTHPYRRGEDNPRKVDWKLSARKGNGELVVRDREREASLESQRSVHLIIDVFHINEHRDVAKIAALLIAMQQGKCDFTIGDISLMAHNSVRKQFPRTAVRQLLADKTGTALRVLVQELLKAKLQNNFLDCLRRGLKSNAHSQLASHYPSGELDLALRWAQKHQPSIVVGSPSDLPDSACIHTISSSASPYDCQPIDGIFTKQQKEEFLKKQRQSSTP